MARSTIVVAAILAAAAPAGAAESVMARCGRDYLAARTAGTLDGAPWSAFRIACAERVKAAAGAPAPIAAAPRPEAAATVAAPATASPAPPSAPAPAAPSAASEATAEPGDGRAAMHARQKQCGAEWTAGKATLVAETPGLTWPTFWSRCNARLKLTGHTR